MFATTDPERVLPTILSRCQRFDLRRIPTALIVKQLATIAKKEKVSIDDAALFAIARGADGGMRDAESALDQLISFCGDKIEEPDVLSMFGLTAQGQLLKLSGAILNGEIHTALQELNGLAQHGKDLGRLLADLLNHFRNLLLFQVSRGDLNMLEVSEIEVAALNEQAALANTDSLSRILEVLADAELRLRDAASKKILIEVTLLRAIEARNSLSLDAVLKQLNALRGGSGGAAAPVTTSGSTRTHSLAPAPSASPAPAPKHTPTVHPAPAAASPAALMETPVAAGNLEELWTKLVESAGRASPFVKSYLIEAHPVSFERNIFIIGFDPEFGHHVGLVDNARNNTLLQTKLTELGHPNSQIKFIEAEAPEGRVRVAPTAPAPQPAAAPATAASAAKPAASAAAAKQTAPVPFNKDDFKNDPLIQKALETFKGTIVDVRA
jgi:DNA polymerase-3 subunit gamma/tau